MIKSKLKWMAILLVILIYNPVSAADPTDSVESTKKPSRITQILSLTQTIDKDSSMQDLSASFVSDLRKKYPHFSDAQIGVMKDAYEDAMLEPKIAKVESQSEPDEPIPASASASKKEKESKESSKPDKKIIGLIQKRVQQIAKGEQKESSSSDISNYLGSLTQEAKRTILLLTVEKGDTLSDIAQRNYNDSSMYIAIYEENKDKLKSPNSVPEGIILKVPKVDSSDKEKFHKMVREYEKAHAK